MTERGLLANRVKIEPNNRPTLERQLVALEDPPPPEADDRATCNKPEDLGDHRSHPIVVPKSALDWRVRRDQ